MPQLKGYFIIIFSTIYILEFICLNLILLNTQTAKAANYEINLNNITSLSPIANIPNNYFGLNGYGALVLDSGSNPKYIENLKFLKPSNFRFHDYIQQDGDVNWRAFADDSTKTWNRTKLNQFANMLRSWRQNGINPDFTITVAAFPSWLQTETINGVNYNILKKSEYSKYAEFVAELVKILNVEQSLGIENIEITNELDFEYSKKAIENGIGNKISDLANLYIQTAKKIRTIDTTIKIGGLSYALPFEEVNIDVFIKAIKESGETNILNFLSIHTYASGNLNESTESIFDRGEGNIRALKQITAKILSKYNLNIPVRLNEYNISWVYTNNDTRMRDFNGSIYEGLTFIEGLRAGFSQISSWNDKDDIYGKMDNNYKLIPSAQVFNLLNNNFSSGQILPIFPNFELNKNINFIVVKDGFTYKILLINRSQEVRSITFNNVSNLEVNKYLTASTANPNFITRQLNSNLSLQPYSMHYLQFQESPVSSVSVASSSSFSASSRVLASSSSPIQNSSLASSVFSPAKTSSVVNTNNNPIKNSSSESSYSPMPLQATSSISTQSTHTVTTIAINGEISGIPSQSGSRSTSFYPSHSTQSAVSDNSASISTVATKKSDDNYSNYAQASTISNNLQNSNGVTILTRTGGSNVLYTFVYLLTTVGFFRRLFKKSTPIWKK